MKVGKVLGEEKTGMHLNRPRSPFIEDDFAAHVGIITFSFKRCFC